jgi:hypothetical protein
MKTLLTKGRKTSVVNLDGLEVTIQEMSVADVNAMKGLDGLASTLRAVVDSVVEDGKKVYTPEDVAALTDALAFATLKKLETAISELNGFAPKPTTAGESPGPKS